MKVIHLHGPREPFTIHSHVGVLRTTLHYEPVEVGYEVTETVDSDRETWPRFRLWRWWP